MPYPTEPPPLTHTMAFLETLSGPTPDACQEIPAVCENFVLYTVCKAICADYDPPAPPEPEAIVQEKIRTVAVKTSPKVDIVETESGYTRFDSRDGGRALAGQMIRIWGGHCARDYSEVLDLEIYSGEFRLPCLTVNETNNESYAFFGVDDVYGKAPAPRWTRLGYGFNCGRGGYMECRLPRNVVYGVYNISYRTIVHGPVVMNASGLVPGMEARNGTGPVITVKGALLVKKPYVYPTWWQEGNYSWCTPEELLEFNITNTTNATPNFTNESYNVTLYNVSYRVYNWSARNNTYAKGCLYYIYHPDNTTEVALQQGPVDIPAREAGFLAVPYLYTPIGTVTVGPDGAAQTRRLKDLTYCNPNVPCVGTYLPYTDRWSLKARLHPKEEFENCKRSDPDPT